jgi:hypothetical protein
VWAPQYIAGIGQINLNPLPPAFGGRQNGVGVEKRKAERIDAEQAQSTEIEGVRPRKPQPHHDRVEAHHTDRDHDSIGRSSARRQQ